MAQKYEDDDYDRVGQIRSRSSASRGGYDDENRGHGLRGGSSSSPGSFGSSRQQDDDGYGSSRTDWSESGDWFGNSEGHSEAAHCGRNR